MSKFKHWADLTPDEQETARRARQDRLELARQKLASGIEKLVASGRWRDYLKFQGKFHRYSFCNTFLILLQRPDATLVASYKTWQKLGRQVRKDESGISIFVPLLTRAHADSESRKHREAIEATDPKEVKTGNSGSWEPYLPDDHGMEQLVGFKIGHVFDVCQTDGTPVPQEPVSLLQGDDAGLYQALTDFARQVVKVDVVEVGEDVLPPRTNGECVYSSEGNPEHIHIKGSNPPRMKTKTLAHELGHALLHAESEYRTASPRSIKELEAESIAFVILSNFGIDSGDYSFGYLATWGGGEEALRSIQVSGERIRHAAHQIITWIEELGGPLQPEEGIPVNLPAAERSLKER